VLEFRDDEGRVVLGGYGHVHAVQVDGCDYGGHDVLGLEVARLPRLKPDTEQSSCRHIGSS